MPIELPPSFNALLHASTREEAARIPARTSDVSAARSFSRPFSVTEVDWVKRRLRRHAGGVAAGIDRVTYDDVLHIPSGVLCSLFNTCIDNLDVPRAWLLTSLAALLKAGKLALEEAFALARRGFASWVSDLRHVLSAFLPLHRHTYDRLHDTASIAALQLELEAAADLQLADELAAMSRLTLLNARVSGRVRACRRYLSVTVPAHRKALTRVLLSDHGLAIEALRRPERYRRAVDVPSDRVCRMCRAEIEDEVHVLLRCRGSLALLALRDELQRTLQAEGVHFGTPHSDGAGHVLILTLADHRCEGVRDTWARYVFRALAVMEEVPLYVLDAYKIRVVL
ncbi:hypothetical protein HDZ31DRAFT_49786 [Schizophyllum fasciatum]